MSTIQGVSVHIQTQVRSSQAEQASNAQFEALLASFDNKPGSVTSSVFDIANSLLNNIMQSLSTALSQSATSDFAFTPSFVGTFGTSGPLPAYIQVISKSMNFT